MFLFQSTGSRHNYPTLEVKPLSHGRGERHNENTVGHLRSEVSGKEETLSPTTAAANSVFRGSVTLSGLASRVAASVAGLFFFCLALHLRASNSTAQVGLDRYVGINISILRELIIGI